MGICVWSRYVFVSQLLHFQMQDTKKINEQKMDLYQRPKIVKPSSSLNGRILIIINIINLHIRFLRDNWSNFQLLFYVTRDIWAFSGTLLCLSTNAQSWTMTHQRVAKCKQEVPITTLYTANPQRLDGAFSMCKPANCVILSTYDRLLINQLIIIYHSSITAYITLLQRLIAIV